MEAASVILHLGLSNKFNNSHDEGKLWKVTYRDFMSYGGKKKRKGGDFSTALLSTLGGHINAN